MDSKFTLPCVIMALWLSEITRRPNVAQLPFKMALKICTSEELLNIRQSTVKFTFTVPLIGGPAALSTC